MGLWINIQYALQNAPSTYNKINPGLKWKILSWSSLQPNFPSRVEIMSFLDDIWLEESIMSIHYFACSEVIWFCVNNPHFTISHMLSLKAYVLKWDYLFYEGMFDGPNFLCSTMCNKGLAEDRTFESFGMFILSSSSCSLFSSISSKDVFETMSSWTSTPWDSDALITQQKDQQF